VIAHWPDDTDVPGERKIRPYVQHINYQEALPMSKGLAQIMKQAQMMQQRMAKLQEEAAEKTAEATVGGGAVAVVVNGKNQILSLTIKKEAVDPEDVEMLQDLIMAAVNEALKQVQAQMAEEMGKVTGGLSIPGLF